jgi:hypothetical protein
MAKKRTPDDRSEAGSRANVKYVALPVELWEKLKDWADQDERSVSWAARKIIRDFFAKEK